MEDQVFFPLYDLTRIRIRLFELAPPQPPPHLPSVSSADDTHGDCERETNRWRERKGRGRIGGVKSYDGENSRLSINHSVLSGHIHTYIHTYIHTCILEWNVQQYRHRSLFRQKGWQKKAMLWVYVLKVFFPFSQGVTALYWKRWSQKPRI
jgi:hypothetical protein